MCYSCGRSYAILFIYLSEACGFMGLCLLEAAVVVMVSSVPSVDNLVLFLRKIRYLEWFHGFSLTGHLEPNSRILIQAF